MSERIETGAVESIVAVVTDQLGLPLLGRTNIKVKLWRVSDGRYLDWTDMTFRPGDDVVQLLGVMSEVNQEHSPGEYRRDLDTGEITNPAAGDTYEVTVLQDGANGASNLPQIGELRVGQWVDAAARKPYQVLQSFSYSTFLSELTGLLWVEHQDLVVTDPVSVSVKWYNASGAELFTMADLAPDAQGVFKVRRAPTSLDLNVSYYAIARVTLADGTTVTSGKGIFTVG